MEPDPLSLFSTFFIFSAIGTYPVTLGVVLAFVVAIILLGFSALISGSEVAFFSLTPVDIRHLKESESKPSKQILDFLDRPDRLLATLLIANNFINVAIVILFSYISTSLFDFSENMVLGFVLEVVVITFMLLLFGEILPKVYASVKSLRMAKRMISTLVALERVLKPVIFLLIGSTNIVNKRILKKGHNISMDELSSALELASDEIQEDKEILEGIVKFGNISVAEIMVSRVDIVDVDIENSLSEVIATIVKSGFSRIPVYHETLDHIKGILYIKDLLPHLQKSDNFRWQSLIRPPFYVPETKKIKDLLEEFQSNKIHLAVVIDEYGGTSGIVTLEDILEEIVGEISDEFDDDEILYQQDEDGSFVCEGKMMINDFFKIANIDESIFDKIRGDADTLAGLILEHTGELPKEKDKFELEKIYFEVLAVDNRRIKKLRVSQEIEDEDEA